MPDAVQSCKHEFQAILELHQRGAKLIALNPDKSPARGFVAATLPVLQSHAGDWGIIPISAHLICIDVDQGDPNSLLQIAYSMGIVPILCPTERGWHLWIHGRVIDDFAYWTYEHAHCKGEIRLGGGKGKGAYCKIWDTRAILDALNLPPANTDTLTDFVHLLRGEIRRSRSPAAVSRPRTAREGIRGGNNSFSLNYGDSRPIRQNPPPPPLHQRLTGYYPGNRNNKLNSDIWHLTMMGKDTTAALAFARQSGLADDEIARTVQSAETAARKHWYWRLMNRQLDTKGLTNRKGDSALRVLQSIARGADWDTGGGSRQSQATIAKQAGCGLNTVRRAIAKLTKMGLLHETGSHVVSRKRYKNGKEWVNKVNVYAIDLELLQARMAA